MDMKYVPNSSAEAGSHVHCICHTLLAKSHVFQFRRVGVVVGVVVSGAWLCRGRGRYTVEAYRSLLEQRAANIIQPDCSHAGGISQMLTLARMAEVHPGSY